MGIPTANLHFTDPKVCRNFLCGTCPHDLFANTVRFANDANSRLYSALLY